MHGLIALLDDAHNRAVEEIWRELRDECSLGWLAGRAPFPHFTWLGCEDYDETLALAAMNRIAAQAGPLEVKTAGLGIFTGAHLVLYASVTRSPELSALHQLIWQEMRPALKSPSAYYEPPNWMPHITLAEGDLTPNALACAARLLAKRNFYWSFRADTLAWARDTRQEPFAHQLRHKFALG